MYDKQVLLFDKSCTKVSFSHDILTSDVVFEDFVSRTNVERSRTTL